MIIELLSILAILSGGSILVHTAGIKGWVTPALGFVVGLLVLLTCGSIQILTGISTSPILTLAVTVLGPVLWWYYCIKQGQSVSIPWLRVGLVVVIVFASVIAFRAANLIIVSPDSYRYLQLGSLLESGHILHAEPNLLMRRQLSVPLMHVAANIADEFYLRSVTPLLAMATVMILAWFCQQTLLLVHGKGRLIHFLTLLSALLLLTNHRFLYNAFYINAHMLYAVLILLLVGCYWLYVNNTAHNKSALLMLPLFIVPILVVSRPEAALQLGLILLPVFVSNIFSPRYRAQLLLVLSGSTIIWNVFLWIKFVLAGQPVHISVVGMLCLGLVLALCTPLLFWRNLDRLSRPLLHSVEIGLWLALVIATLLKPAIFFDSLDATIDNIVFGWGLWGYSLILLVLLFICCLLLTRVENRIFLRYPVTIFIPFGILMAFMREQAYRLGFGDSLNRMFFHMVPLAILFITASALTTRWGFRSMAQTSTVPPTEDIQ